MSPPEKHGTISGPTKTGGALPKPGEAAHRDAFDWLRVAAVLGIVWFHADPGNWRWLAYSGLPIFLLMSTFLAANSASGRGFREHLGKRARRLLLPWAFWSLLYALWTAQHALRHGTPVLGALPSCWLVAGGAGHLWYFPFIFAAQTALFPLINRHGFSHPSRQASLALLIGTALFFLLPFCAEQYAPPQPVPQWFFSIPVLFAGYALACAMHETSPRARLTSALATVVLYGVLAGGVRWACCGVAPGDALANAVGVLLVTIALFAPLAAPRPIRLASDLSMGIYVLHPFCLGQLERITGLPVCARVLAAFLISAAMTWALQHNRWTARFV